jgi:hypothetical protein
MKVPQKAMKKWIAALRGGEYNQAKRQLQSREGFCCLGVACEVFLPEEKKNRADNGMLWGTTPNFQPVPKWLIKINADVENIAGVSLMVLNDRSLANFKEIADLLESLYVENP